MRRDPVATAQPFGDEHARYAFAHVNRLAVRCYYCSGETRNPMHARAADGTRIKVCRKKHCRERVARPRA